MAPTKTNFFRYVFS